MKLNEKAKNIRLEKRLTSQEVADKIGMTRTGYSYWENGKTARIYLDNALKLAAALGVPFNELFDIPIENQVIEVQKFENEIADLKYTIENQRLLLESSREKEKRNKLIISNQRLILYFYELLEVIDFEFFAKHNESAQLLKNSKMFFQSEILEIVTKNNLDTLEKIEGFFLPFIDVNKYENSSLLADLQAFHEGSTQWNKKNLIDRVKKARENLQKNIKK